MAPTFLRKPKPPDTELLSKGDTQQLINAWDRDPAIVELLPLRFRNGAELNAYTAKCGRCGQDIRPGDFRGTINFPIHSVAVITAAGVCHDCNVITRYAHRLRDTLTLEWVGADGQWKSEQLRGTSTAKRLFYMFARTVWPGRKR